MKILKIKKGFVGAGRWKVISKFKGIWLDVKPNGTLSGGMVTYPNLLKAIEVFFERIILMACFKIRVVKNRILRLC